MPHLPQHDAVTARLRLMGSIIAGFSLTLAIVVCHVFTGSEPVVLTSALLIVVGFLCREVTTWEQRGPPPPAAEPPGPPTPPS